MAVVRIIGEHGPIPVIFITGKPRDCVPCDPPTVILPKPVSAATVRDEFRRLASL